MKKIYLFISLVFVICIAVTLFAANYTNLFYKGTFLNEKDVIAKWGSEEFTENRWKTSTIPERTRMVASLLRNKQKYIGKTNIEIREIFGDPDSHYLSEALPAYTIQENTPAGGERWDVVFLINKENKIIDIRVHRNYPE